VVCFACWLWLGVAERGSSRPESTLTPHLGQPPSLCDSSCAASSAQPCLGASRLFLRPDLWLISTDSVSRHHCHQPGLHPFEVAQAGAAFLWKKSLVEVVRGLVQPPLDCRWLQLESPSLKLSETWRASNKPCACLLGGEAKTLPLPVPPLSVVCLCPKGRRGWG